MKQRPRKKLRSTGVSPGESHSSAGKMPASPTANMAVLLRARVDYSFQVFNQLQHVSPIFRGDVSRAVVRSAVLPFVVLLEQTPKSFPRISIEPKGFCCSFGVYDVWIDRAITRCERGFQSNNSRGFRIIFPRGR